jgi:predicted site-specific integrase-resolvase
MGSSLRNGDLHGLLCKAALVFHDWPHNYFSFLDWRKEKMISERHTKGLSKDFGEYKYSLYKQLVDSEFNFMRDAFEEYLAMKWDGGYVSGIRRLSRSLFKNRKFASKNDAKKILKVSTKAIDSWLQKGQLNGVVRSVGCQTMMLIEMASLRELDQQRKQLREQLLDRQSASKRLGTTTEQIAVLENLKLINLVEANEILNQSGYARDEIDALLNRLAASITKSSNRHLCDKIGLPDALRRLRRCSVALGKLLRSILNGEIRPCGMKAKLGISGLTFYEGDITAYARAQQKQIAGALRIREAAQILKIDVNAALSLVKKGLLTSHKKRMGGRLVLMISERAITDFCSKYVLSKDLAKELDTTSTHLIGILKEEGINPVSGRTVDGGTLCVFKRAQLEGVDLHAVWSAHREEIRQSREQSKLIGVNDAARFFETERENVLGLVASGVLRPHKFLTREQRIKKEFWFSRYRLDTLKDRIADYNGLISIAVAARLLQRTPQSLLIKYVRTGRLNRSNVNGDKRQYFRRNDVEELITWERKLVTTSQAALILQASMSQMFRWTACGVLKPVSGPHADGYRRNLFLRSDVECLSKERRSFKVKRVRAGGSSRFGMPAGPKRRPVLESRGERAIERREARCQSNLG